MQAPSPDEVRATLAPLDARGQKIVAGLFTVMIQNPTRVREREWISEQLTEVTLLAGGFEADSTTDGVGAVQEFLQQNSDGLLGASYQLFQRVGLDLQPVVNEGFTSEDAVRRALEYFPSTGPPNAAEQKPAKKRELGEQPIARLMAERGLKAADLVRASTEQITHRMVSRAMKGRRLTSNSMDKVHRAWNLASSGSEARGELFDYRP